MAEAYPNATFTGFDVHEESLRQARENAKAAGVGDRVRFEVSAAKDFPGEDYDLVTCFDCLHDMGAPVGRLNQTLSTAMQRLVARGGYGFGFSSRLTGVAQSDVWTRISSWEGVNYELSPIIRMTHPKRFPRIADIPADGKSHFVSYLLFLGFIPIDAHRFGLRRLEAPHFFHECSSNLLMKTWSHHRTITVIEEGVEVRDECSFVARISGLGWLLQRVYSQVFRRRHRRLRKFFQR